MATNLSLVTAKHRYPGSQLSHEAEVRSTPSATSALLTQYICLGLFIRVCCCMFCQVKFKDMRVLKLE